MDRELSFEAVESSFEGGFRDRETTEREAVAASFESELRCRSFEDVVSTS